MRSRSLFVAAKAALSLGLVWLIASRIDATAFRAALSTIPLVVLAEVTLLLALQPPLLAYRWMRVIGLLGQRLPFREALRLTFVGLFFNHVLPTSIGGDAFRMWGAHRAGVDGGTAAGSVLIDRASGLVTVALLIVAAIVAVGDRFVDETLRPWLLAPAPCGLFALALAAFADHLPIRWLPRLLATPLIGFARMLRQTFSRVGAVALLFCLGTLAWLPLFVAIALLAATLGTGIGLAGAVIVSGGSLLLAALPISVGGWGVRELAMVSLFGALGLAAEPAFLISLLIGAVTIAVSLPGGLLWLVERKRPTAAPSPGAAP